MNRLQSRTDPIEENLSLRLGDLLANAWNDPLSGGNRPYPDFEAALHFLLGCELAFRFGPGSSLALSNGLADPVVNRRCVSRIEAVLRPWELCVAEPGFNAVLSLTHAWRRILAEGLEPGEVVRAAFAVPFQVEGIERLKGFVGCCLMQFEEFGDWFMSGFVKVHHWFDEACPDGPDPRMDALTVFLTAPYSGNPIERGFVSAIMASRPDMAGFSHHSQYADFLVGAFDWARRFPMRFPGPHGRLIDEIETDPRGPGMEMLVRIYRHWFGDVPTAEWRDHLLNATSRYVPTVVADEKTLAPWSLQPSVFRVTVDFAAWAGITQAYLEGQR